VQETPDGAPQAQGVHPRLSATPPYTMRCTEYPPPGHATWPTMKTQRRGSRGAAGAGAHAALPQPAIGTTAEDRGVQLPPSAGGDAPMPWTFAHFPWTLTQAPADTSTLSHALVHPGSPKIVAVKLDGHDAPVRGPQSHMQ
jgi:hypothetical protein